MEFTRCPFTVRHPSGGALRSVEWRQTQDDSLDGHQWMVQEIGGEGLRFRVTLSRRTGANASSTAGPLSGPLIERAVKAAIDRYFYSGGTIAEGEIVDVTIREDDFA